MSDEPANYTTDTPLTAVAQRTVDFYGDEVSAVLVERDNQQQVYVPLRQFCDYLGLNWSGQLQRLRRDRVLNARLSVCVIHTDKLGAREAICLPLDLLPGWLFGVSTNRVKPELEEKIDRYRLECFRVLWQAFQANAHSAVGVQPTSKVISALEQVRTTALAVAQLAEQQIELERRQEATDKRLERGLDRAAVVFDELRHRLDIVEKRTAPETFITDAQAAKVANQVRALAEHLTGKDNTKNWYQSIFAAIYRQFDVTSYQRIRKNHYEEVMQTLEGWRRAADTGQQLKLFDEPEDQPKER